MAQQIYCDESGFTGTHLSDKEQPYFVYTSVAISQDLAAAVVREARQRFRIQSLEIKGSSLIKSVRGRKAVSFFLESCLKHCKCVVIHKKYALACKLFEYIFEPPLSQKNSIFYNLGFHRYVSTLLLAELQTNQKSSEQLFERFEHLMQSQDSEGIEAFFGQKKTRRRSRSVAKEILAFAYAQRASILEELQTIQSLGDVGRWTLDVTDTALFSLLCHWGAKLPQLDVFCDESKPLFAYLRGERSLFSAMIGRTDKQYFGFGGGSVKQVTFNLARPISLIKSKESSGIQVADVISAAVSYGLKHPKRDESREWLRMADDHSLMHEDSILPNLDDAISHRHVRLNALLLKELVRRSRSGEDLLTDIEGFVLFPYRGRRRSYTAVQSR